MANEESTVDPSTSLTRDCARKVTGFGNGALLIKARSVGYTMWRSHDGHPFAAKIRIGAPAEWCRLWVFLACETEPCAGSVFGRPGGRWRSCLRRWCSPPCPRETTCCSPRPRAQPPTRNPEYAPPPAQFIPKGTQGGLSQLVQEQTGHSQPRG